MNGYVVLMGIVVSFVGAAVVFGDRLQFLPRKRFLLKLEQSGATEKRRRGAHKQTQGR
jgi:hypothetical protein